MAMSEAKRKANDKYISSLDDIKLRVPKGMRDTYKKQAKALGYSSFNEFAIKAIEEKIEREKVAE